MLNGIDNKNALSVLKGKKLGFISNPTGVDKNMKSTAEILKENFSLAAVFSPEHGIRGDQQAGVSIAGAAIDSELGVPSYSLHHANVRRPTPEMLEDVEMMVYDIQDVGARFYTYIYTMAYSMEECAKLGIPFVVLDRCNPLGGLTVEGLRQNAKFNSFVGAYGICARYGLTPGEIAMYINEEYGIHADLTVVPCSGWKRSDLAEMNGRWIMPSPNIPTSLSAFAFVATVLFEATNVSEGRGTTHPFEMIGAPFVDARKLVNAMRKYKLPGVEFRPIHYAPTFSKYAGELCHGLQLHITDTLTFTPFECGLRIVDEIRNQCSELTFTTSFDYLLGDESYLLGKEDADTVIQRAKKESAEFAAISAKYRLYD